MERSLGVRSKRKDTSPWGSVELKFRNNMISLYEKDFVPKAYENVMPYS